MLKRPYIEKKSMLISATITSIAILFNTNLHAANAIVIDDTTQLHAGDTVTFSSFGLKSSYSDHPIYNNSSQGTHGNWYTIQNHDVADVTVSVFGDPGFAPGVSVWASGNAEFDGGSGGYGGELNTAGIGTPFSINSNGVMGDAGTLWMADGQGGNMKETLGYAVSGPTHLSSVSMRETGWGEDIITGAHDVSLTNTYENGVTGSVSANTASLVFDDLAVGWYAVYVGGTDDSLANGEFDLVISAVPETETWAMLIAGLGLIGWRLRKQQNEPNMLPA